MSERREIAISGWRAFVVAFWAGIGFTLASVLVHTAKTGIALYVAKKLFIG